MCTSICSHRENTKHCVECRPERSYKADVTISEKHERLELFERTGAVVRRDTVARAPTKRHQISRSHRSEQRLRRTLHA